MSGNAPTEPPQRLIVVGAVEVGVALCRLGGALGWRTFVADPRDGVAGPERFPDAEAVSSARPEEAYARFAPLDAGTAVVVLAHDPEVDDDALELALRSEAGYVGAIGSRRTQAARRERLLARGMTEVELARMASPIGLDLGGLGPGEMALSIAAEIVALRRGRAGGRLKDAAGPIGGPGPEDAAGGAGGPR